MKNISLHIEKALGKVTKDQIEAQASKVKECIEILENGYGRGNDIFGWLHLPS